VYKHAAAVTFRRV